MSVINFDVRDLNNKENMIGQNGLMLLDKMAQNSGVEKCACREFNTCKEGGIKGEKRGKKREERCRKFERREEEEKEKKKSESISCECEFFITKRENSDFGLGNKLGD